MTLGLVSFLRIGQKKKRGNNWTDLQVYFWFTYTVHTLFLISLRPLRLRKRS